MRHAPQGSGHRRELSIATPASSYADGAVMRWGVMQSSDAMAQNPYRQVVTSASIPLEGRNQGFGNLLCGPSSYGYHAGSHLVDSGAL